MNALLTNIVFQTVLSGVLVFVLGQLFLDLILKPYKEYQEIKGQIEFILVYYGNALSKKNEDTRKASNELRKIGARLQSYSNQKSISLFFIPKRKKLRSVVTELLCLSLNADEISYNYELYPVVESRIEKIYKLLKLKRDLGVELMSKATNDYIEN